MTVRSLAVVLLLVLGAIAPAADVTLKSVRFGKPIQGEKLSTDDLKGKVVLVEMWGINCGPCIASMPHLVGWHADLSDGGLAVIGMHMQNGTDDEVKTKAKSLGMRFPLTAGGSVEGVTVDGIPHCMLFDHTGAMVYEGHPNKVEAKLRDAFADMLAAEAGEKPAKAVTGAIDTFKKGGTTADMLKKLAGVRDGGDTAAAKQAKAIITRMQSGAQTRLDTAKKEMKEDPIGAYDAATLTATRWKGTALGKDAAELSAKLKDDKAVAAELKARPTLEKVKAMEAMILASAKGKEPDTPEFKKAFALQLKHVEQTVANLKKSAPDTPATAEAEEIAKRLGAGSGK